MPQSACSSSSQARGTWGLAGITWSSDTGFSAGADRIELWPQECYRLASPDGRCLPRRPRESGTPGLGTMPLSFPRAGVHILTGSGSGVTRRIKVQGMMMVGGGGCGRSVYLAFWEDPERYVNRYVGLASIEKQDLSNLGSNDAVLNTDVFIRVGEHSWALFKETM